MLTRWLGVTLFLLGALGCQQTPSEHGAKVSTQPPPGEELPPAGEVVSLEEVAYFGGSRFMADADATVVAMSPDGSLLASGGSSGSRGGAVILWDVATGDRVGMLRAEHHEATQLAFSPDGATLASSALSNEVVLWDIESRRVRSRLEGHPGSVYGLAYAPSGELVASHDGEGVVMLFGTDDGSARTLTRDAKGIHALAFSPDAKQLALAHEGRITLWDVATAKRTGEHEIQHRVHALGYGPQGKQLLIAATSAAHEQQVIVLDLRKGKVVTTLVGHDNSIYALRMTSDGNTLVTASSDGSVRVWDVASGGSRALDSDGGALWSLALSPDEHLVAAAGRGRMIRLWNLRTGGLPQARAVHEEAIVALAYSPSGESLVSGDAGGVVVARDPLSGELRYTLPRSEHAITTLHFSPDGARLFTVSSNTIRAFDARGGAPALSPLTSLSYASITFSPDGRLVAGSTQWPVVDLVDVASGELLRRLGQPDGEGMRQNLMRATSVAFSPDGQQVATARWDEPVQIFEVESGERIKTLPGTLNVAFGNQDLLATNAGTISKRRTDLSVKVWDPRSGAERCTITGAGVGAGVGAPQFADPGDLVAAIVGGELHHWRPTDCVLVARATKAGHAPLTFVFSPDGSYVASGGRDADVVIWRTPTAPNTAP